MPTYSWARVPPLCTGPRPSCIWCSWSKFDRCSGSSPRPRRHTWWCRPSASLWWPAQQPSAVAAARCPCVPSWRAVSAACRLPSIYRTEGWSPSRCGDPHRSRGSSRCLRSWVPPQVTTRCHNYVSDNNGLFWRAARKFAAIYSLLSEALPLCCWEGDETEVSVVGCWLAECAFFRSKIYWCHYNVTRVGVGVRACVCPKNFKYLTK